MGGPPMPGAPGMAPRAAPKILKFPLNKPKLDGPKEGKTKAFGWKRVVIDRAGFGEGADKKPPTMQVVDNGLRKLDNNFKGLKTIWVDIEDDDPKIKLEDIQEMFKDKVKKTAIVDTAMAAAAIKNKKKSFFTDKA
jgi:hypothetical protein